MTTQRNVEVATESLDAFVGRRVHMLMWDTKITQTALSHRLGVDQSTLSKRLRGERGWGLDDLRAIAKELGTNMAFLLGETDDPESRPRESNPRPSHYE